MMQDDFERIESSLDIELPETYKEAVLRVARKFPGDPFPFDRNLLLASEQLIDINNFVWQSPADAWSDVAEPVDYYFIGEDGCGNYYCIEQDDEDSPVFMLSHDPIGFFEQAPSIADFIAQLPPATD